MRLRQGYTPGPLRRVLIAFGIRPELPGELLADVQIVLSLACQLTRPDRQAKGSLGYAALPPSPRTAGPPGPLARELHAVPKEG